jgi:DNA-binding NtrC family response regulator
MLGLFIQKGIGAGGFIQLDPAAKTYVIGRAPDSSVCLEEQGVSRQHAEIVLAGDAWLIRDLGSRNGTYLNALPVREKLLAPRDLLIIGTTEFLVVDHDPTVGPPSAAVAGEGAGTVQVTLSPAQNILGTSSAIRQVIDTITSVASLNVTVLIRGETGTGKELVARAIHSSSKRRDGPFVALNCGAIPENLIESELFGYEKGAFTGAVARRQGRFEEAAGGTLFLDEIGDLPLPAQVNLLRVLQEKTVRRVGGLEEIRVDVRMIAATHRELDLAVQQQAFRQDLYHRLKVVEITVPPLRERRADIPLLAERFLSEIGLDLGTRTLGITDAAQELLQAYDWPGNVRELRNVLERAAILARGRDVSPAVLALVGMPAGAPAAGFPTLAETESMHVARALKRAGGDIDAAAAALGIDRTDLVEKMQVAGAGGRTLSEIAAAVDAGSADLPERLAPGETLDTRLARLEAALARTALEDEGWDSAAAAAVLGASEEQLAEIVRRHRLRPPASKTSD